MKEKELQIRPVISKVMYAVLLSSLQPHSPSPVQSVSAPHSGRSRLDRAVSIVHLVDRVIPGGSERLSRGLYSNSHFPWLPVDIELIASGTGAAVFKLNWSTGPKVLRIYRRSLGQSLKGLLQVASYYRNRYRMLRSWYDSSLGLVLEMEFFIWQGPHLLGPVAASLQPYIQGQMQDLFQDFSDEELLRLLEEKAFVREQFLFFARQTFRQWEEGEMCLDFLGSQNVMIVNQDGNHRLYLPDPGIFELKILAEKQPGKFSEMEERIHRLARLYEHAKEL